MPSAHVHEPLNAPGSWRQWITHLLDGFSLCPSPALNVGQTALLCNPLRGKQHGSGPVGLIWRHLHDLPHDLRAGWTPAFIQKMHVTLHVWMHEGKKASNDSCSCQNTRSLHTDKCYNNVIIWLQYTILHITLKTRETGDWEVFLCFPL